MSFNSGTVTASATPAKALCDLIHTEINAHADWQYIEEVTSGGQFTKIYKSKGSSNSHGADFYVGINRTADNGTAVKVVVFEQWTTGGTGTITFPITTTSIATGTLTPDASGRYNGATSNGISLANCLILNVPVNTTAFYWNVSVTKDRVVIATKDGSTTTGIYAGAYERLYSSVIDPVPLCLVSPSTNQNVIGSSAPTVFGRELAPFVSQANNWKGYVVYATSPLGPHGQTSSQDMTTGHYVAVRCLIGGATSAARASARGQLRDVLLCSPNLSPAAGDTATISGVAYTCAGPSGFWVRDGA